MKQDLINDNIKNYSCNYNCNCIIKYQKVDNIVFVTNLVVKNGVISVERLLNNRLIERYILGTLNNLDSLSKKIDEEDNVYDEYRSRLLQKKAPILYLEIYETLAGTGFIDNTLDLVQVLEGNNVYDIIEELKDIIKNVCEYSEDRYTEIEKLGYINIINGYIMRLEERRNILNGQD